MSTMSIMADQVLRRLHGGDVPDDSEWDEREIILALSQARDKFMKDERYLQQYGHDKNSVLGSLLSTFRDVEVKEDTALDLEYVVLPAGYSDIYGITHISEMLDQDNNFKFMPQRGSGLFSNYDNLEGRTGFWPETGPNNESRVYFRNLPSGVEKVLMKYVANTLDIDENDPAPMPSFMADDVIEHVYRKFAPADQVPKDKTQDQSDTK